MSEPWENGRVCFDFQYLSYIGEDIKSATVTDYTVAKHDVLSLTMGDACGSHKIPLIVLVLVVVVVVVPPRLFTSHFFTQEHLQSAEEQGYRLFVVRGDWPPTSLEEVPNAPNAGLESWWDKWEWRGKFLDSEDGELSYLNLWPRLT